MDKDACSCSRFGKSSRCSGKDNSEFGKFAGSRIDLNRAGMLLDDDIVADGQAKAGTLAGRLGRKKRVKHLVFHFRRDTGAIVAYPDLYTVTEISGGRSQSGLLAVHSRL